MLEFPANTADEHLVNGLESLPECPLVKCLPPDSWRFNGSALILKFPAALSPRAAKMTTRKLLASTKPAAPTALSYVTDNLQTLRS
jgi:hypothetical protein